MLPSANDIIGDLSGKGFTLISDNTSGRNGIFNHHFIGYGIKTNKKVVIFGLDHSLGHYHLVGMKLGINIMKAKESGSLHHIDGSTMILNSALLQEKALRPELGLQQIYTDIVEHLCTGSILIIDNLSILTCLGFSDRQLNLFLKKLLAKVVDLGGHLVCTVIPSITSSEFKNYLARWADIGINVEDLRTGKSRDVSGHLSVCFRLCTGDQHRSEFQFRVEDKSVKIFPPGTSAAVL